MSSGQMKVKCFTIEMREKVKCFTIDMHEQHLKYMNNIRAIR